MRELSILGTQLLDVLEREHRGRANAGTIPRLAGRLHSTPRAIQAAGAELVEHGHLVGSSCRSERPGLFMVETSEDLEEASRHVRARALGALHRVAVLRRAAEARFAEGIVGRLFDLQEAG